MLELFMKGIINLIVGQAIMRRTWIKNRKALRCLNLDAYPLFEGRFNAHRKFAFISTW